MIVAIHPANTPQSQIDPNLLKSATVVTASARLQFGWFPMTHLALYINIRASHRFWNVACALLTPERQAPIYLSPRAVVPSACLASSDERNSAITRLTESRPESWSHLKDCHMKSTWYSSYCLVLLLSVNISFWLCLKIEDTTLKNTSSCFSMSRAFKTGKASQAGHADSSFRTPGLSPLWLAVGHRSL